MRFNPKRSDIDVILAHPHGEVKIPLEEWLLTGPGERDGVRPIAAKSQITGESLPMSVIPLRYRNNQWSRLLIKLGFLSDPWKPSGSFVLKDYYE